jgi:ribonuclease HII
MAAAVILPESIKGKWKSQVRDSKMLTAEEREYLFDFICDIALSHAFGSSPNEEIDSVGIAKATRLAMVRAIKQLDPQPQFLLIDYISLKESYCPQKGVVDGDTLCFSIACASIIAKVARDRVVLEMDKEYPGYNFAGNKGYATEEHLACLREKGPCPLHRRCFSPVSELVGWNL